MKQVLVVCPEKGVFFTPEQLAAVKEQLRADIEQVKGNGGGMVFVEHPLKFAVLEFED